MSAPDSIHAVISDHRAAWDAFQVAPDGEESLDANCVMSDALDALVLAACAFPILTRPLPEVVGDLLAHLRWWLAEEAEFAADYQPEYGVLQARAADLAVVLETPAPDGQDPVFAAIAAADAAALAHTASLAGRNEDDDVQMRRANAAADAASTAFVAVEKIMPTTWGGLLALVEFYGRDLELYDRCSQGGGYFKHLAAAMRGCESSGAFWPLNMRVRQSEQSVARVIPRDDFQASERVAA